MDIIEIGVVTKPQGLKGGMRIKMYSDNYDILQQSETINIDNKAYDIEKVTDRGGFAVVYVKQITDINDVEKLRRKKVYINKGDIDLADDEVLIDDIIGFKVISQDNKELGVLQDISVYANNEVYTVVQPDNKEMLFPNARGVVLDIDTKSKMIVLDEAVLQEIVTYN